MAAEPIGQAFVEIRADLTKLDADAAGVGERLTNALKPPNLSDDYHRVAQQMRDALGVPSVFEMLKENAGKAGESVRQSFVEAEDKSNAALSGIGKGDEFANVKSDAAKAGDEIKSQLTGASTHSKDQLSSVGSHGGNVFGKLALAASGLGVGFFLKDSLKAADESASGFAGLQKIIESTGHAAGLTADQVAKIASQQSVKIGVDDDEIIKAQEVLLTFKNIGGDSFSTVTGLAADMSKVFGGDLTGSATQLGKALNDPTQGISALSRVGVTFTDQQKEQIKTMQAAGDMAGAQAVVMKELKSEVGGAAEASATGTQKIGVAFGNMKENLGAGLAQALGAIAPSLTALIDSLGPPLVALGTSLGSLLPPLLAALAPALSGITQILPIMANSFGSLFKAIAPVIPILATGLVATLKILQPILPEIIAGLIAFKTAVAIEKTIGSAKAAIDGFSESSKVAQALTKVWTGIQTAFNFVMDANPIVLVGIAIAALVAAIVVAYFKFDAVRKIVDDVWQIMQKVWDWIENVFVLMWHGLHAAIDTVVSVIQGLWDKTEGLRGFIAGVFSVVWEAWRLQFLVARDAIQIVIAIIEWLWNNVLAPFVGFLGSVFAVAWEGFKLGFSLAHDAVQFVIDKVMWLWHNVLAPVADFLGSVFAAAMSGFHLAFTLARDAVQWVVDKIDFLWHVALEPLVGFVAGAFATGMGVAKSILGDIRDAFQWVIDKIDALIGWIGKIKFPDVPGWMKSIGGGIGSAFSAINPFNAIGGIFDRPTLGVFAEAGKEAIIPTTLPGRAMQLMQDSGLGAMWDRGGGSGNRSTTATVQFNGGQNFYDGTNADLVAQRVSVALAVRMVNA